MGVEFRVGYTDHKVVEDFLSEQPPGVSAVVLEATNLRHQFQREVAEAAIAVGKGVIVDPLTDRLAEDGFSPQGLDYVDRYPIDVTALGRFRAQAELVERVLAAQYDFATVLVPPYFYAGPRPLLELNIALAGLGAQAARAGGKPMRAILAVQRVPIADDQVCADLARGYRQAGVEEIELRLSPLGGEDDGPLKVASGLGIVDAFRAAGLRVSLGTQGNIGQTALALGLIDSSSTGVGVREHFNQSSVLSRQRTSARGRRHFGAKPGVFLPVAGATVPLDLAKELYSDATIRSRLACRLGHCAKAVDGPVADARRHYLHSRADLVETSLGYPENWRPTQELDRLRRALDFRETLNRNYLSAVQLKTRTIRALGGEIEKRIAQARTA